MSDPKGDKVRAGKMLSKFLKRIADEETELVDDPNCGQRQASKAEALARIIWRDALGYVEVTKETVDGKVVTHERKIHPDKSMIALIWDRIEGRVTPDVETSDTGLTLSERVTEAGKKRIAAAGGIDETDGHAETDAT